MVITTTKLGLLFPRIIKDFFPKSWPVDTTIQPLAGFPTTLTLTEDLATTSLPVKISFTAITDEGDEDFLSLEAEVSLSLFLTVVAGRPCKGLL